MDHNLYFDHNIDLIAQSRKSFRLPSSDDKTESVGETYYVWDIDSSQPSFIIITTVISNISISYISVIKTMSE